jgi:hypothetical protein
MFLRKITVGQTRDEKSWLVIITSLAVDLVDELETYQTGFSIPKNSKAVTLGSERGVLIAIEDEEQALKSLEKFSTKKCYLFENNIPTKAIA